MRAYAALSHFVIQLLSPEKVIWYPATPQLKLLEFQEVQNVFFFFGVKWLPQHHLFFCGQKVSPKKVIKSVFFCGQKRYTIIFFCVLKLPGVPIKRRMRIKQRHGAMKMTNDKKKARY